MLNLGKWRRAASVTAFLLIMGVVGPPHAHAQVCDTTNGGARLRQAIAEADKSTVLIETVSEEGHAVGSGFIYEQTQDSALVVTNNHVAGDATRIKVTTLDGRHYEGTLVGRDQGIDLAVVKIKASGLQAAKLGSSADLQLGDEVFAIGNPLGVTNIVTPGIIDGFNKAEPDVPRLMTSAALNHGNSGGALFDLCAEVVGVNTAIYGSKAGVQYPGFGFAIDIDLAKKVIKDLITRGKYHPPFAGLKLETKSTQEGDSLADDMAVVKETVSGSPAEKSGVKAGDVITSIDGARITSRDEALVILKEHSPGDTIKLSFTRNDKPMEISITLGDALDDGGKSG